MKKLFLLILAICSVHVADAQTKAALKAEIARLQVELKQCRDSLYACEKANESLIIRIRKIRKFVAETCVDDSLYRFQMKQPKAAVPSTTQQSTSTGSSYSGYSSGSHVWHTGPRGGQYYINSKGNKVYRKRK